MTRGELSAWLGVLAAISVAIVAIERRRVVAPGPPSPSVFAYSAEPAPPFPLGPPSALGGGPASTATLDETGPTGSAPTSADDASAIEDATSFAAPPASASAPAPDGGPRRREDAGDGGGDAASAAIAAITASASGSASNSAAPDAATAATAGPRVFDLPIFPVAPSATMLVTLSGSDAQRAWSAVSSSLRGGDLVVAHVGGDASLEGEGYAGLGDQIRADRPLVSFVLAVDDPARLAAMTAQGFPASVAIVGFGAPDGWDAGALAAASTAIRGAGKQVFVTANASPGAVGFDQIGQRADVVELRARGADASALAAEIEPAVRAIRAAGQPLVYVALPGALAASADSVSAAAAAIGARLSGVGLALPGGTSSEVLGALRGGR